MEKCFEGEKIILKNKLITSRKFNLNVFDAKVLYSLMQKYLYEVFNNRNYSRIINVKTSDLKKITNKKNFDELINSIRNMEKSVTIEFDIEKEAYESIAIVTGVKCEKEYTSFVLNYDVCKSLEQITDEKNKKTMKEFGIINMIEINKLKSCYTIKAYEICCRYKNQKEFLIKIDDFKEYFEVPKSYENRHLGIKIINIIEKEINEKTNFSLKIKTIKDLNDFKKISHYKFIIEENKNKENILNLDISNNVFSDVDIDSCNISKSTRLDREKEEFQMKLDWFESIWKDYPNKQGKDSIARSKTKINELYKNRELIHKCLETYKKDPELKVNGGFKAFMNGSTFFNGRYKDFETVEFKKDDAIKRLMRQESTIKITKGMKFC